MGKRRWKIDDLRVKQLGPVSGETPIWNKDRPLLIAGVSTRKYYDSSSRRYNIFPMNMNKLVSLTEVAIRLYNIKEHTKFGQVKLRKVVRALGGLIDYRITFEAFSPLGVASVFIAKISQFCGPYRKVEIRSVKMKCSQSDDNGKNSKQDPPPQQPVIKTLNARSLKDMAPYLAQHALVMYNYDTLHVRKRAVHDIPSLKVVKAMKYDAEGTTYLITFKASLHDESWNVETFEAQICVPTLFPTMTIELREIKVIKQDCYGALPAECAVRRSMRKLVAA